MKKILFGFALFFILGAFIACDNPSASDDLGINNPGGPLPGLTDQNPIPFRALYVHTQLAQQYVQGIWVSGIEYPIVTIISSRAELEQYCDDYQGLYDFSGYQHSPTGFMDAIENYSDAFFADNFLVFVLIGEGSGSIRHRVEGIGDFGDISITRLVPEIGTM